LNLLVCDFGLPSSAFPNLSFNVIALFSLYLGIPIAMRVLLCALFFFMSQTVFSQSNISWNMAMSVASSSSGNNHPRIATDANGNPLVLWWHASRAMFSRWNGTAFTAPVLINPASMTVAGAGWMGPDIAAHGDTVYVVFKQSPEGSDSSHIFCARSFDGGQTFNTPVRVDNIADSLSRFPTVTTDDSGNPIIGFMKFNSSFLESRWVVARSSDFGNTFSIDTKASGWSSPTSVICDCCPGALVSTANTVAMLYRDNNSDIRDIWAGMSYDGGNSFVSGMDIDQSSWVINACPATGPDGIVIGDTLYSTYMSAASGNSLVYWSATSLSAMNGSQGLELTGNFAGLTQQNYPRIASDGTALAVVWKQRVNGTDQCMLRFSPEATSFNASTPDTIDQGDVTNADVAMVNGNIYIVWQDDMSGTVQFRSGSYSGTTNVQETNLIESFSVYPNPAENKIQFQFLNHHQSFDIRILDLSGKEILKREFVGNENPEMDTRDLASGMYLVQMRSGKFESTKKLGIVK